MERRWTHAPSIQQESVILRMGIGAGDRNAENDRCGASNPGDDIQDIGQAWPRQCTMLVFPLWKHAQCLGEILLMQAADIPIRCESPVIPDNGRAVRSLTCKALT